MTSFSASSPDLQFLFSVSRSPNRLSRMALAMGSIMAVVAVLLSHMERNDAVSIMPRINLHGTQSSDNTHNTLVIQTLRRQNCYMERCAFLKKIKKASKTLIFFFNIFF